MIDRARLSLLLVFVCACDSASSDDAGGRDAGMRDAGALRDAGEARDAGADAGGTFDDLDALLEPIRAGAALPALGAAAYEGETLLGIGAVGARRIDDATAVTDDDRWHLGSCTKAMTATLIAIYVEEGLLAWDTTLAEAFPALSASMDPAFRGVTIAQLLAHRGGMDPQHTWMDPYWGDARATDVQRGEVAMALLTQPPSVPVGDFAYANSGYVVAAAALEAATGRTWEDLMRERIFGPLGMTSCGFGPPGIDATLDEPRGHYAPASPREPMAIDADNPAVLGPAGRVHCSMRDWARFIALHLAGARGEPTALLTPASFARMHTPSLGGDYALGWAAVDRSWAAGTALTHNGSNNLWFVVTWIAPERDRFVLVVTNVGGDAAATATDGAAAALIGRYLP